LEALLEAGVVGRGISMCRGGMGTSSSGLWGSAAREREALGLPYLKSSSPSFPSDEDGRFLFRPANHQIHALFICCSSSISCRTDLTPWDFKIAEILFLS
jgi:hypothetical protein